MDVIVVDSVAALVPRAEIEGDMGDHHVALQARLMSQALRKLTSSLSKANCLIIFINQIRSKVGVLFGSPDVTSGGNALKFYSSGTMQQYELATLTVKAGMLRSLPQNMLFSHPWPKQSLHILNLL